MANANLSAAKNAKNDEFYTQLADIEREMNAYLEYDPDVFKDKVILLPCDDPEWSNFAKFFALHFTDYGLKKLISTSYAQDSKPAGIPYQPSLFETEAPQFDEDRTRTNGKMFVLERKDINGDGVINIDDLQWKYLHGDGDFRSAEVTALRDEADVVVTNPPFSQFRDFLAWIMDGGQRFLILGNINAITYKEVFPLIRDSHMWLGVSKGARDFTLPGGDTQTLGNTTWFTNLDHGRRHQPIPLMSEADNVKFSRHKQVRGVGYRRYDNYDAIEVGFVDAIPSDYDGVMGVPISFLDKYDPDQFEILGLSGTHYPTTKTYGKKERVVDGVRKKSNRGTLGCVVRTESFGAGTHYDVGYPVRGIYRRIFIRHRNPEPKKG